MPPTERFVHPERSRTGSLLSRRQLVRLQTLWSLLGRQQGFDPQDRSFRLTWVEGVVRNSERSPEASGQNSTPLTSFKDLTRSEAEKAIDAIQKCLPPELVTRRPRRRRGAKGQSGKVEKLPQGATLELIGKFRTAILALDPAFRFDAWMRSPHGPLRGRVHIRSERDAQAVVAGLKQILRRLERTQNAELGTQNKQEPAEVNA